MRPQIILDFFHGGLKLFCFGSEVLEARISARLKDCTLRSFKLLRLRLATGELLQSMSSSQTFLCKQYL